MNLDQRQTGRSTRTRDQAIELAGCGFAVYLLVADRSHIKWVEEALDKTWNRLYVGRKSHGIKVEAFDHHWADQWNWGKMAPMSNFHGDCRFLMDHTVIEKHISDLQNRMKVMAGEVGRLYQFTV